MIPDSTNQDLMFVEWMPDWSKPVVVGARHETGIVTSNNGVEQRSRRRNQARYSISFVRSGLDARAFSAERIQARRQIVAPLVCPLWTDRATLATMLNVDRAGLTTSTTGLKFKAGHYAYFVQSGLDATFRKVVGVGPTYLDLDPIIGTPEPPFPVFGSGASVYPAMVGFRPDATAAFVNVRVANQEHAFAVEEL